MLHSQSFKKLKNISGDPLVKFLGRAPTVNEQDIVSKHIRIYFTDEGIGGSSEHLDELEAINSASEGDVIFVHMVGCPGGDVSTTMAIINALSQTPAQTVCVIEGHNASAASIIPLACSEVVVTPYCSLMCHTGSGAIYGTLSNTGRNASFSEKLYHGWISDVYQGFLTEEEIKMIFDGVEIYLDDKDIETRLKNRANLVTE